MIPLFQHYPLLGHKLPYVSLCELPTPVHKLEGLGDDLGVDHLYIKRDDLTGRVYGGNKIRKLEFILGEALRSGAKEVLTVGLPGLKHPLSAAIYAQQVGLKSISMMMPQTDSPHIRRNLLMSHRCGAELHQHPNMPLLVIGTAYQLLRHKLRLGSLPRFIRGSRSCPLGTIGYVNAAFELKQQIMNGEIPEPDCTYVALGSMGTAVGLILGLKAAKLGSRVTCVRAIDERTANPRKMVELFDKTTRFLHSLDPAFPKLELSENDIDIRHGFYGRKNGLFTQRGMEARKHMENSEGIELDEVYTERAFACLLGDAEKGYLRDKVVLFWNTYDSGDFSDIIATVDYRYLPRCFHRYFEEDVQPLDKRPQEG